MRSPRADTVGLWFALSAQPLTEVWCMVGTAHRVVKGENEQWELQVSKGGSGAGPPKSSLEPVRDLGVRPKGLFFMLQGRWAVDASLHADMLIACGF